MVNQIYPTWFQLHLLLMLASRLRLRQRYFTLFVNPPMGIHNICVCLIGLVLGVLLTLVIDVLMFCLGVVTPVYYFFLNVMLIHLSILMGCLTPLKGYVDKCYFI